MSDERGARTHLDLEKRCRFSVTFPELDSPARLVVDETPPLGEGQGPNPAVLPASAVSGCLASSLLFCLSKARGEATAVAADAVAHIVRNEAGRFRVGGLDVTLSVEVPEDDQAWLQRCEGLFEDFCIVTESVEHGIMVNVNVRSLVATWLGGWVA